MLRKLIFILMFVCTVDVYEFPDNVYYCIWDFKNCSIIQELNILDTASKCRFDNISLLIYDSAYRPVYLNKYDLVNIMKKSKICTEIQIKVNNQYSIVTNIASNQCFPLCLIVLILILNFNVCLSIF